MLRDVLVFDRCNVNVTRAGAARAIDLDWHWCALPVPLASTSTGSGSESETRTLVGTHCVVSIPAAFFSFLVKTLGLTPVVSIFEIDLSCFLLIFLIFFVLEIT